VVDVLEEDGEGGDGYKESPKASSCGKSDMYTLHSAALDDDLKWGSDTSGCE